MRKRAIPVFLVLLIVLAAFALPVTAAAAGNCTLSISYYMRESGKPLADVDFHLYQVAEGKPEHYTLTEKFEGFAGDLTWDGTIWTDAAKGAEIAAALSDYISRNSVKPDQDATTDENGELTFRDLEPGLYLVLGDPVTEDGKTYTAEPVLIWLPAIGGDGRSHNSVIAAPKPEPEPPTPPEPGPSEEPTPTPTPTPTPGPSDEPTPTPGPSDNPPGPSDQPPGPSTSPKPDDTPHLPQTGQLWWPVPVLLAVGVLLLISGAMLFTRKEEALEFEEFDE